MSDLAKTGGLLVLTSLLVLLAYMVISTWIVGLYLISIVAGIAWVGCFLAVFEDFRK